MAKKTRKQKILADSRHVQYHLETSSAQVSFPNEKKSKVTLPEFAPTVKARTVNASSNLQVISDLRKTALVTGAIFTAQIILFIILNRV